MAVPAGWLAGWLADQAGLPANRTRDQLLFDLAISPANPDVMLAATDLGLYRSTNGGANFSLLSPTGLTGNAKYRALAYRADGVLFAGKEDGAFGFSADNLRIALIPGASSGTDRLLISTSGTSANASSRFGLFQSTNSGASFSGILTGADIFAAAANPDNPNEIIAGSGSGRGVWRSVDGGASRALSNLGLRASASIGFARNPLNAQQMIASNSAGLGFRRMTG